MPDRTYVYGRHPVRELLQSDADIETLWVLDTPRARAHLRDLLTLATQRGIPVRFVPRQRLDKLARGNHQGIVARVAPFRYASLDDILARAAARGEPPFVVLLDHLEDVHNVGAIIRTAEAAGAHGIVLPERRAAGITPTVYKTSAGAVQYLPVARVPNLHDTMQRLKAFGIWWVGLDMNAPQTHTDANLTGAIGVVVGAEGRGMSRRVREACDFLVRIPMRGRIQSLNASVAAGIVIYEVVRQRLGSA
nr:23S rRNA (guanosine(2251)-2'-O)-methyltransferase RlmB [Ardenticatena sp.]